MLEMTKIYKTFNKGTVNEKKAIVNINLNLNPGDFVTIIGGNGAGKSTLLNLVAGVYPCDNVRGSSVVLGGTDITRQPEYRRAKLMGRVFQDPMRGTASDMEIEENLAIAYRRGSRRGLGWGITKEERELYHEKLKILGLGLEDRMNTKVGLLSGGQRQALTLLMATLKKPEILLLDEHTAALDPKTAKNILRLTDEIISQQKLTTMMVTHNMRDAIKYGNRLIMMDEGNIIFDIRGEEKQKLEVEDLLKKFESVSGTEFANDRMLLS